MVKRDIFNKVAGGVRIMPLMERQAQAAKVAAAVGAAAAGRTSEAASLDAVVQLGGQGGLELVNATLARLHEAALAAAEQQLQAGELDAAGFEAEAEALAQQLESDAAELAAAAASCPDLPFYAPGGLGCSQIGRRLMRFRVLQMQHAPCSGFCCPESSRTNHQPTAPPCCSRLQTPIPHSWTLLAAASGPT